MAMLPPSSDPALLVGSDTLDDAAVYRLNDEIALVQTVDFFTPVVDDPYDFGRIAAANAFSDIYAMGGRPLTALNIVSFPSGVLPLEYLARILQGGAETARLASATIVGGHTIDDPEPKYGMAVTGIVKPGEEMTNAGAAPGDLLVLTKALGTGIIATAIKQGRAGPEAAAAATLSMAHLNRVGSEVARQFGVRALTDITGFGLLGHLSEMCRASRVGMDLWFDRLPVLPGAVELVRDGVVPGGTRRNLEFVEQWTEFAPGLEGWQRLLCADAQTSGGLVLCLPPDSVEPAIRALEERGTPAAAVIGQVRPADAEQGGSRPDGEFEVRMMRVLSGQE
jgi:selenide,water dikinase